MSGVSYNTLNAVDRRPGRSTGTIAGEGADPYQSPSYGFVPDPNVAPIVIPSGGNAGVGGFSPTTGASGLIRAPQLPRQYSATGNYYVNPIGLGGAGGVVGRSGRFYRTPGLGDAGGGINVPSGGGSKFPEPQPGGGGAAGGGMGAPSGGGGGNGKPELGPMILIGAAALALVLLVR